MTQRAKIFLLPALSWIGLAMTTVVQAQSGSRQESNTRAKQGVAVVELFTSQGCSSCPSADTALRQIADSAGKSNLPVFVLSFHVDYWNRLGWTDPYSDASFSERQRSYAAAMKSNRVYTPQMIVNGTTEFVGSHTDKARKAIAKSLGESAEVTVAGSLQINKKNRQVALNYNLSREAVGRILNVAVVQTPESTAVPKGENAGRELSHVNVVRAFRWIPIKSSSGNVELDLPEGLDASSIQVIAYVQDQKTLAILGATAVN